MTDEQAVQPEFAIQRVYTKDLSFESPDSPQIFTQEWHPEVNIDLQTSSAKLDQDYFEMILGITVTVKNKDKVAFLVEVREAGIFTLKNFPEDQIGPMMGIVCPSIIFPYAREVISDIAVRGGFPQLLLAPINFEALYTQQIQQQQQSANENSKEDAVH